ncbi:sulfurtransferase-like selenium metabolism protein YedF [Ferrimonas lipolytica]|uniref:Sulfurtransferase-like selenium metabolism protein YedF n=1 Tax=Ferrimonas lipolytica TaxID=2724191 RepID=A0A6H1U9R1_9GAMM|nr:sulfurtransferase-like selenium metabolism protein YedF [Ferrimonas lipolytica]QIZ75568.1 sulfurtransferase-like selenium metabolism protein YedF [Ferrimonas lipolytica]
MHNNIDVRGIELDRAVDAVKQVIKAKELSSLEIQSSAQLTTTALLDILHQQGANCEVMDAAEGQTIIANLGNGSVMEQKSYVVGSTTIGSGDDVIGSKLMNAFFNVSADYEQIPASIFLLNSGVKLCIEQADSVPALTLLQQKGCDIIVCGTCLDFFGIKDKLAVGRIGTMHDLIGIYHNKGDVISL